MKKYNAWALLYRRPFVQFYHLVFLITAKRLSKTGDLGKEDWGIGKMTTIAVSLSEGKSPLLTPFFLAQRDFVPSFILVQERKKSQMGENKGDFIKLWKFKTPCQGMQKRHRSSCNTLVAPSLPQKDLPSHVNSFLVEVQWSTWRPAASTFFLPETGENHWVCKCVNFLNSKNCPFICRWFCWGFLWVFFDEAGLPINPIWFSVNRNGSVLSESNWEES